MSINLAGPTAAITTNSLTAATYTFVADMAPDSRTKAFVVSALGGTQTGVQAHSVDAPKQFLIRKPAQFLQPSAYNVTTGRYGKVPKNVTKCMFRGSAKVAANQWESVPITFEIGAPAGAASYDRANLEASIAASIAALWDQKEEIILAIYDGLY